MTSESLWLCLYFRELPVEVFTRHLDDDTPVVILENRRVSTMNETAMALGVRTGSSLATIATLGSIRSFDRDTNRETSALFQLAQWAYQFTPRVSINPPDSLLLDVTGCLKLFKGLAGLKAAIDERIATLGYKPVVRVNTTPLAALYTARAGAPDNTDEATPSLLRLPVNQLQVESKIIASLEQTGIHTLEDLLALPESGLTRRFGTFFVDHLQRLTGKKPDPRKFIDPAPRFFSELTFLSDVTNVTSLIFPARRLLGELHDFLNVRQLHVNRFTWTLAHRAHQAKSFSIHLANPENDLSMFQALTQLHLDRIDDVEEIDCLRLVATSFFAAQKSSGDLFAGTQLRQRDARPERNDKLLNMLRARLGPQTCFGLSMANDHRPEKAWKPVRLDQKHYWSHDGTNPRPFYLLDSPKMLETIDDTPCLGGKLTLLKGPERIDFGWWDQPRLTDSRTRDYYIARHDSGALYWIFNYHPDRKWYLHGIFS